MKEKLQEYALIAEIISAVCIVLSLIFVGFQIQQNSEISEVSAYQNITEKVMEIMLSVAEDENLSNIFVRFRSGQELNEIETFRLGIFMISIIKAGEITYLQYQKGLIDEEQLRNLLSALEINWNAPIMKQTFENSSINEEYRSYVESWLE